MPREATSVRSRRGAIGLQRVEDAENGIAWPAISIVDKDRKIVWRSLSQTCKIRAVPGQILEALPR